MVSPSAASPAITSDTEARELLDVHEAVLEYGLGDLRRALGARHQRHELSLEIGGEAGKRRGGDLDGCYAGAIAADADAFVGARDLHAGAREPREGRVEEIGARAFEHHVAAGHGDGHGVGANLE